MNLPQPVAEALARLEQAGFSAFVVGGAVRDSLLGETPRDWDLATAARPEQVKAALAPWPTRDTGPEQGTVTAFLAGQRMEITTFRVESGYSDHRRPDRVTFAGTVQEDLARRDFTVNAVAFSPKTGWVDPFGGRADGAAGLLRTVGDPAARLEEDPLRILRGLRLAAQHRLTLHPDTARAMADKRDLLSRLSAQRVGAEMLPLLCGPEAVRVLREQREIFGGLLPQLTPMFGFDQRNPHHCFDVWEHTLHAVEAVPPEPLLRAVMLLHDCGKPACFTVDFRGDGHFYGHGRESARLAEPALRRLGLEGETLRRGLRLIALHDYDVLCSEKSLLRWLALVGPEDLTALLEIKRADNLAQSPRYFRGDAIEKTRRTLEALLRQNPCYDRKGLAVTGGDLKALGLEGPDIGAALDELVEAVICRRLPNEREGLLAAAKERLSR